MPSVEYCLNVYGVILGYSSFCAIQAEEIPGNKHMATSFGYEIVYMIQWFPSVETMQTHYGQHIDMFGI